MALGLCARCARREGCGFRQPGTWVTDCDLFDEKQRLEGSIFPQDRSASLRSRLAPALSDEPGLPALHAIHTRRKKR